MKLPKLQHPKDRDLSGGDLLAQSLKLLGVEVAFGIHGGHLDAFLIGAHEAGIRLVDTRHETVAVQAAEGYSKIKGKVGVCFVTANSGFSNGLPGLATAFADKSPIFCVTSSIPLRDDKANVLQGFHDQVVVAKPITRFATRVTSVEEIPRLVSHAWRVATSSSPGPVLIDFPIDVLFTPVQELRISWGSLLSPPSYPAGAHPEAVTKAAELLRQASQPVIVTGTGAYNLHGNKDWETFLSMSNIPVFNSTKWSSPLSYDHPLRGGLAANLVALEATGQQPPDVVLLLGCRTGFFFGSRSKPVLPSTDHARYIHVDTDAGEIGQTLHIELGITSSAEAFISALNKEAHYNRIKTPPEWTKLATSLKTKVSAQKSEPKNIDGRIHPYWALENTWSALTPGSIISIDGGDCGSWGVQNLEHARCHTHMFSCGYLGFLGNGYGYSLGAAIAAPDELIVNLQGDGSGGLHLAELDTYARFGCKVLTVVVNNCGWGMSANGQDEMFPGVEERPATKLSPKMSFAAVAKGLGVASEVVDKAVKIEAAVKRLTSGNGPALLELLTSRKPTHPGTVAMVGKTDDKDMIVIPYYDNVPRPVYRNGANEEKV